MILISLTLSVEEYKMSFRKKIVLGLVGAIAASAAFNAYAVDEKVTYKIHDVSSVKEDNEVTACNFSVTFYNRTPQIVSDLSLDISWLDDVVEERIKEEKKEPVRNAAGSETGYSGQSKTEQFTSKKISTNLSVPPLPPSKQISLKATIKTDRCFLLLDQPQLKINSCKYGSEKNVDRTAGVCNNLFAFVSPESGEYYTEFKPITYDEQKKEIEQQQKTEQKELDTLYNNAISSVKRISQTLDTMQ